MTFAALLLALPVAAQPAADFSPLLDDPALDSRFLGTVRITRGEEVLLELSRGLERGGDPASQATTYWLGSISKHFASVALLSLLEESAIPLDRPVASLIEEWPDDALRRDGVDCTIEQLLSHQCGLPRDAGMPGADLHRNPQAEATFLERLRGSRLAFTPGSSFRYSNAGFDLAGVLVSRLGRAPYHEVLEQRLFAPRGLAFTAPNPDAVPGLDRRIAPGHFPVPWGRLSSETWLGIPWSAPARVGASGDLFSTAPELGRWFRALLKGEILGAESTRALLTPRREDYGLGLVVEKHPAGRLVWHNGAISPHGHNAYVGHLIDTDTTVVVLVNEGRAGMSATKLGRGLVDLAHGRDPGPLLETPVTQRLAGGLPGLVFIGLPVLGLFWCLALLVRPGHDGLLAWLVKAPIGPFLIVAVEAMLSTFRPSRMALVLPAVLVLLAMVLAVGLWRFRDEPLVRPGRERSTKIGALVTPAVIAVLASRFGALAPTVGLAIVTGIAAGIAVLQRRATSSPAPTSSPSTDQP